MKLREMATAWFEANCPNLEVQEDFQRHFDRAMQRDANCSFLVGRNLTKGRKPNLVYCFGSEFFAFELTPRQVARLGMKDNVMACAGGPPREVHEPTVEPFVSLKHIAVDNAESLSRLLPITGTLQYRAKRVLLDPVAIKVDCEPPGRGRVSMYHHLPCLAPREGTLKVSMHQIGDLYDASGKPFAGVVPLFFQIWTAPQQSPHPALQAFQQNVATGRTLHRPAVPATIAPVMPASSPYPPAYDPGPLAQSQPRQSVPISDIRAVLVEAD
jgi:hypothetical protein